MLKMPANKTADVQIAFTINGVPYKVDSCSNISMSTSLNTFIREHVRLPGTKFMCREGGCGVCVVTVESIHPFTKKKIARAANSCLLPVYSCNDFEITTIEGVGNRKDGYHNLQKRLADFNGSQCGFCSPGMVMSMFSLMTAKSGKVSMEEVEKNFGGNICRCTGYRPILDAFKSFAFDADEKLKNACKDIEDLPRECPRTKRECEGVCEMAATCSHIQTAAAEVPKNKDLEWHEYFNMRSVLSKMKSGLCVGDQGIINPNIGHDKLVNKEPAGSEWHTVFRINDIFSIFKTCEDKPYMLAAGNTANGVYRRSRKISLFIDISRIEELSAYSIGDVLELGANMTLTDTITILNLASKKCRFAYCTHLARHIELMASTANRNMGTIAGNLSIKHQYHEFPSDIYVILATVGAKLIIVGVNGKSTTVTLPEYLNTDMTKRVITRVILPAMDNGRIKFRTYKVMPRAQNAHAYVNAGFLLTLDANDTVSSASICYGGINPEFLHATKTERFLLNKDLYNNQSLNSALETLASEINPDEVMPDASPVYRKNLALALFYKFCLATCKSSLMNPKYQSGGQILQRPISSGTQDFDTNRSEYPMTENIPKIEGLIQCAGEAEYVNDIPSYPRELWAAFVLATKPRATITAINADDALKVDGVFAVYTAKDIPGDNNFMCLKLPWSAEVEPVLCTGTVRYHSEPCAIVLADSFVLANYAASLCIVEYDINEGETVQPSIFEMKDLLAQNKLSAQFSDDEEGDGPEENARLRQNVRTTGHFELGPQYHFTMEPQTCLCVPSDEGMNVYSASQWKDHVQCAISAMLKIPENMVNVYVKRVGGGYGAKISRASMIACACALAAHLSNRPVRFVMQLEQNMRAIGKRYPCANDYSVESDANGKILRLKNRYAEDYGCSLNEQVLPYTDALFSNVYMASGWDNEGIEVRTDSASQTFFRAPGTLEGYCMIENIMEHIAQNTGKDPLAVRLQNMGDDQPAKKLLIDFSKSVEYAKRRKDCDDFNSKNRWRKRGISVVPMLYPIAHFGGLHVCVSIYHLDGTVSITHGGIEIGQGINTKAVQVAAHIFGLSVDKINVKRSNSIVGPNDPVTGGSYTTDGVAFSVKKACDNLMARIKPIKDANPSAKWEEITQRCYAAEIDLCEIVSYKSSEMSSYIVYGTAATEVEVDILTGNYQIPRVDIWEDAGQSISPGLDIGQVEGAFMTGIGYFCTERLVYDRTDGELLTDRTWTYKPPGARDIPIDFRITLLKNRPNERFVLRSKAIGEPPLLMSVSVLFALRQALDSARKDAKVPNVWYHLGAPTTPEVVFLATGYECKQYKFNEKK